MIVLNDFKKQWQTIGPLAHESFNRVGESGELILGKEVARFEKKIGEMLDINFAVGCGSGLDALELSLRCLNIQKGDHVLTTPLSAFATTLAILKIGAVPVLIDIDDRGMLDLDLCEQILKRKNEIKCILPVHLYGQALNLSQLEHLRTQYQVSVLEDCAQSIMAEQGGKLAGSIGEMAAMSLYPTKNLGALGDGGVIMTNHSELADKARSLRNYGQVEKYQHEHIGYNSRLDELHAALLNDAILPHLKDFTKQRVRTAQLYLSQIKNPCIEFLPSLENSSSVWHIFPVLIKGSREKFQQDLLKKGIQTAVHYPTLISDQPAITKNKSCLTVLSELKKAQYFANHQVSLPIHPFLTDNEIDKIIESCNQWSH